MAEYPAPQSPDPAPPVDSAQRARVARGTRIAVIVVLVLLVVGAGRTIVGRMANAKILEANVSEGAVPYVRTTVVRTTEGGQTLSLPGSLQGFQQAPLAARSAGYVKRWTKDIGSHVTKGELLAVIESPEIDQQLSQAEAVRGQTAASLALAKSTVERWEALRKKDVVSQQELDERRSGLTQASANLAAADANVQRLRQLDAFKRVTAPFARISYTDAVTKLRSLGSDMEWGRDLGGDDETLLAQQYDRPVFVYNYPKGVKAFYMKENPEDPRTVLNNDCLAPEGYGEIIGGSQREDDYDKLLARIIEQGLDPKAYEWYLDLRKYGTFVHSGFGLGIERTVAWICGIPHVREAIAFPRQIYRLYP